jgi:hypothetical protein
MYLLIRKEMLTIPLFQGTPFWSSIASCKGYKTCHFIVSESINTIKLNAVTLRIAF